MRSKFFISITVIAALTVVAITAIAAFRTSRREAGTVPRYTGAKEKITVANIGEFTILNVIAKEKGFFDSAGLEVTVVEYSAGPASIQALLSGEADIAMAADFVGVLQIAQHPEIRIIAEASRHQVFNVVARADKDIAAPEDLRRKRIGVTKGSVGEYYLGRYLALNNMSVRDVVIADYPPAELTSRLESGSLDAIFIFDPHAFNLRHKLGDAVTVWPAQGDKFTYDLFYTKEQFVRERSESIRRYLVAMSEAQKFVVEKPEEAQDIVQQSLRYTPEYTDQVWRNHEFRLGLDQDLLLSMEAQTRFAIDHKLIHTQNVPNYLDYMYFGGLDAVAPASISIIH